MFKFGFSNDQEGEKNEEQNEKLRCFPVREIFMTDEDVSKEFDAKDTIDISFHDFKMKLLSPDRIVLNLKSEEHENIIRAESQHSDLLPGIYEGGLKIWECSHDLGKYLVSNEVDFEGKRVLDLGCGSGILGIVALLKGATVYFQDYNTEVIQLMTIPNVLLNLDDRNSMNERIKFYSGDWGEFAGHFHENSEKFDVILSSETIYNQANHEKLYQVFKELLKDDGVVYLAGKTYYFGVGGGMRQFENLIKKGLMFDIENIWKSKDGVQREIMQVKKPKKS